MKAGHPHRRSAKGLSGIPFNIPLILTGIAIRMMAAAAGRLNDRAKSSPNGDPFESCHLTHSLEPSRESTDETAGVARMYNRSDLSDLLKQRHKLI